MFDLHGGLHDGAGSVGVFSISFMLFEVSGHEIPKPKRMPGLHDRLYNAWSESDLTIDYGCEMMEGMSDTQLN